MLKNPSMILNDILTANCLRYKEIKTCQECRYWEDCEGKKVNKLILLAVKEWLEKHEIEEPQFQNEYYQNQIIDDLVKDLEVVPS